MMKTNIDITSDAISVLEEAHQARSKKLNKIETVKNLKSPQEAYEKLKEYDKTVFDSIAEEDKTYFLKCFGIYYRAATPEKFMLKLRISGGFMKAE